MESHGQKGLILHTSTHCVYIFNNVEHISSLLSLFKNFSVNHVLKQMSYFSFSSLHASIPIVNKCGITENHHTLTHCWYTLKKGAHISSFVSPFRNRSENHVRKQWSYCFLSSVQFSPILFMEISETRSVENQCRKTSKNMRNRNFALCEVNVKLFLYYIKLCNIFTYIICILKYWLHLEYEWWHIIYYIWQILLITCLIQVEKRKKVLSIRSILTKHRLFKKNVACKKRAYFFRPLK